MTKTCITYYRNNTPKAIVKAKKLTVKKASKSNVFIYSEIDWSAFWALVNTHAYKSAECSQRLIKRVLGACRIPALFLILMFSAKRDSPKLALAHNTELESAQPNTQ